MKKILLAGFLAAALFLCGCNKTLSRSNVLDPNYDGGGTGFVEGYVKNSSSTGLTATLSYNNGTTATAGSDGHFSFSNAPAGNQTLTASCAWYAGATQSVLLNVGGSNRNVNFTLQSGRPSGIFPYGFENGALSSPWISNISGGGTQSIVSTYPHTGSQSCKLSTSAINDDAQIKYVGLNALKGAKATAWMYTSSLNMAVSSLKFQDTYSNGPEIGIKNGSFYYKNVTGSQNTIGGVTPVVNTWYRFDLTYEIDTSNLSYVIYDNSATPVQLASMTQFPNSSVAYIDRFVIENYCSTAGGAVTYADDVDLIKK